MTSVVIRRKEHTHTYLLDVLEGLILEVIQVLSAGTFVPCASQTGRVWGSQVMVLVRCCAHHPDWQKLEGHSWGTHILLETSFLLKEKHNQQIQTTPMKDVIFAFDFGVPFLFSA